MIVAKVGYKNLLARYRCAAFAGLADQAAGTALDEAHTFLAAFSLARKHVLWVGVPDKQWAARKVLKDYVSGRLLHCEMPMGPAASSSDPAPDGADDSEGGNERSSGHGASDDDDDFKDLDAMLVPPKEPKPMTKRKMRFLTKNFGKGKSNPAGQGFD